jgi:ArsR family transcriptional regulator, arsenate/arsenite/antimonite-responsive transcriptional repressor
LTATALGRLREMPVDDSKLVAGLRALGDPTRMAIFQMLRQREHCNCEMVAALGVPPNLISHHLRVLRETGLLRARRHPTDARWVYYSIDAPAAAQLAMALAALLSTPSQAPAPAFPCCAGPDPAEPAPGGESRRIWQRATAPPL